MLDNTFLMFTFFSGSKSGAGGTKIYERSASVGSAPTTPKTPTIGKKIRPVAGPVVPPDYAAPHTGKEELFLIFFKNVSA